jgi:hypothetical protein
MFVPRTSARLPARRPTAILARAALITSPLTPGPSGSGAVGDRRSKRSVAIYAGVGKQQSSSRPAVNAKWTNLTSLGDKPTCPRHSLEFVPKQEAATGEIGAPRLSLPRKGGVRRRPGRGAQRVRLERSRWLGRAPACRRSRTAGRHLSRARGRPASRRNARSSQGAERRLPAALDPLLRRAGAVGPRRPPRPVSVRLRGSFEAHERAVPGASRAPAPPRSRFRPRRSPARGF